MAALVMSLSEVVNHLSKVSVLIKSNGKARTSLSSWSGHLFKSQQRHSMLVLPSAAPLSSSPHKKRKKAEGN